MFKKKKKGVNYKSLRMTGDLYAARNQTTCLTNNNRKKHRLPFEVNLSVSSDGAFICSLHQTNPHDASPPPPQAVLLTVQACQRASPLLWQNRLYQHSFTERGKNLLVGGGNFSKVCEVKLTQPDCIAPPSPQASPVVVLSPALDAKSATFEGFISRNLSNIHLILLTEKMNARKAPQG